MAIIIKITKSKVVTLHLPSWLAREVLGRNLAIILASCIVALTAWIVSVSIVLPLTAPASLKPEEITGQKVEIDQDSLNDVLSKNEAKQGRTPFGTIHNPFSPSP